MVELNINTDAVVKFTNILEGMKKSALPNAVRGSLNNAVFDVKTNTMPTKAGQAFIKRSPNFFKANSSFEKASGWDIAKMEARVGFTSDKLQGGNNYAVKDLEQQESGGVIGGRSFIPLKDARQGGNYNKLVKPNARLGKIMAKNMVRRRDAKGASWGQQMIKSAVHVGVGGLILTEQFHKGKGGGILLVKKIERKGSDMKIKTELLYSVKKNRKINVKPRHFMSHAALLSGTKIEAYFIKEAQREIAKYKI